MTCRTAWSVRSRSKRSYVHLSRNRTSSTSEKDAVHPETSIQGRLKLNTSDNVPRGEDCYFALTIPSSAFRLAQSKQNEWGVGEEQVVVVEMGIVSKQHALPLNRPRGSMYHSILPFKDFSVRFSLITAVFLPGVMVSHVTTFPGAHTFFSVGDFCAPKISWNKYGQRPSPPLEEGLSESSWSASEGKSFAANFLLIFRPPPDQDYLSTHP